MRLGSGAEDPRELEGMKTPSNVAANRQYRENKEFLEPAYICCARAWALCSQQAKWTLTFGGCWPCESWAGALAV